MVFMLVKNAEIKSAMKNGIKGAFLFFILYTITIFVIWYPFREFQPTFNPYSAYNPTPYYFIIYWCIPFTITLAIGMILGVIFKFMLKKLNTTASIIMIYVPASVYILFSNIVANKAAASILNLIYDLTSWLLFLYVILYFFEEEKLLARPAKSLFTPSIK